MECQWLAADREHATMHSDQPSRLDSVRDGIVAEADRDQLRARDDRVLAGG